MAGGAYSCWPAAWCTCEFWAGLLAKGLCVARPHARGSCGTHAYPGVRLRPVCQKASPAAGCGLQDVAQGDLANSSIPGSYLEWRHGPSHVAHDMWQDAPSIAGTAATSGPGNAGSGTVAPHPTTPHLCTVWQARCLGCPVRRQQCSGGWIAELPGLGSCLLPAVIDLLHNSTRFTTKTKISCFYSWRPIDCRLTCTEQQHKVQPVAASLALLAKIYNTAPCTSISPSTATGTPA